MVDKMVRLFTKKIGTVYEGVRGCDVGILRYLLGYSLLTGAGDVLIRKGEIMGSIDKVEWKRLVWFSMNIPKHFVIAWMEALDRLPTTYREIWEFVLRLCGIYRAVGSWNNELLWAVSRLKGKSLLVFGEICLDINGVEPLSTILGSIGGLLRDHGGNLLSTFSKKLGSTSLLQVEFWGVFEGLKFAWSNEFERATVQTDNAEVYKLLSPPSVVSPYALVRSIAHLANRA
ncbi:hypothetical protein F3Y22_tig00110044pilonHSYRG00347 [Hibiscus syriacus]|uniref:RNase H type-1 domain-containing protein n=1 Tax=Hibiscus syriacus TaxID=106335 RepID=A0A6A3BLY5_HIBSY|nr:hypothetical protein F3Y22_tig00110044pilonHSYRG00347 [Hibiscus syriacus]